MITHGDVRQGEVGEMCKGFISLKMFGKSVPATVISLPPPYVNYFMVWGLCL